MLKIDTAKAFAESFKQAAGNTAGQFSSAIRFVAIMLVILAIMWCINSFMDAEEKQHEGFLIRLGSRLIRIVLALCLFILLLIVKGN